MSNLKRVKCHKEANGIEKSVTRLYNTLISATRRNKEFSLTLLYINNLMKHSVCSYTGVKFSNDPLSPDYMTLERIDNSKGYVDGNVIPVRQVINTLRGSKSMPDLINQLNQERDKKAKYDNETGELSREHIINFILTGKDKEVVSVFVNSIDKSLGKIRNLEKAIAQIKLKREKANDYTLLLTRESDMIKGKLALEKKLKSLDEAIDKYLKANYYGKKNKVVSAGNLLAESQQKIKNLEDLIKGITKFESLTWKEKQCVSVGIPLNSSLKVLLKSKLAYNIIGG